MKQNTFTAAVLMGLCAHSLASPFGGHHVERGEAHHRLAERAVTDTPAAPASTPLIVSLGVPEYRTASPSPGGANITIPPPSGASTPASVPVGGGGGGGGGDTTTSLTTNLPSGGRPPTFPSPGASIPSTPPYANASATGPSGVLGTAPATPVGGGVALPTGASSRRVVRRFEAARPPNGNRLQPRFPTNATTPTPANPAAGAPVPLVTAPRNTTAPPPPQQQQQTTTTISIPPSFRSQPASVPLTTGV